MTDDAMAAEFDTMAEWTAEAALALGRDHYVPAGCRGTGRPAAFDWLLDRLEVGAGDVLVDVGAGVGGPAAYAADRAGVRPVLFEPAAGACRAARRLFAQPTVRADATALPIVDGSVGALWCLGVVCTTDDQLTLLREIRRTLTPHGRAGLLVFVTTEPDPAGEPEGNDFPTRAQLLDRVAAADMAVLAEVGQAALASEPTDWQARADAVEEEVKRRHGSEPAWRAAQDGSAAVGHLIADGTVHGLLLVTGVR